MTVMVAFPLSLVVILSSISFFIDIDILDFFPNCSYIFFTLPSKGTSNMPRTESSLAVSQEYLGFYYLSSAILFLGSSLGPQCRNGSGPQIIGPHSSLAPPLSKVQIFSSYWNYQIIHTQKKKVYI